jgi:DNA-binding NtrC family response regulator
MPHTILVVEDDLDLREALGEFLSEAGYGVVTAQSAEHAIELLKTILRPCLVLLDYVMPGVGADGLLDEIEALADAEHFKVVLMTGLQGAKVRTETRLVHTLMKPFKMDVLLGLLVRHCGSPNQQGAA